MRARRMFRFDESQLKLSGRPFQPGALDDSTQANGGVTRNRADRSYGVFARNTISPRRNAREQMGKIAAHSVIVRPPSAGAARLQPASSEEH